MNMSRCADRASPIQVRAHCQHERRDRRQNRRRQHGRLGPKLADDDRHEQHASRRPDQVREVKPVRVRTIHLENQAQRRSARHERQQAHDEIEVEALGCEGKVQDRDQKNRHQQRGQQRHDPKNPAHVPRSPEPEQKDQKPAQAPTEQSD